MRLRGFIFLLSLTLLAALGFWFGHDALNRREAEDTRLPETAANDYLINFQALMTNPQGQVHYRLSGQRLTRFSYDDSAEIIAPVVRFQDGPQRDWIVYAERGWLSPDQQTLRLLGAVQAIQMGAETQAPLQIHTHDVTIWPQLKQASTLAPARIEGPHYSLEGIGMKADLLNDIVELHAQTRGVYVP